jgi:hypothetical protein
VYVKKRLSENKKVAEERSASQIAALTVQKSELFAELKSRKKELSELKHQSSELEGERIALFVLSCFEKEKRHSL